MFFLISFCHNLTTCFFQLYFFLVKGEIILGTFQDNQYELLICVTLFNIFLNRTRIIFTNLIMHWSLEPTSWRMLNHCPFIQIFLPRYIIHAKGLFQSCDFIYLILAFTMLFLQYNLIYLT